LRFDFVLQCRFEMAHVFFKLRSHLCFLFLAALLLLQLLVHLLAQPCSFLLQRRLARLACRLLELRQDATLLRLQVHIVGLQIGTGNGEAHK